MHVRCGNFLVGVWLEWLTFQENKLQELLLEGLEVFPQNFGPAKFPAIYRVVSLADVFTRGNL